MVLEPAHSFRYALALGGALSALIIANPAGAEEEGESDAIRWSWRRHHAADYVATGAFAVTALVSEVVPHADVPRWRQTNGFDEAFRAAFALGNFDDGRIAGRVSDVTMAALLTHRVIVDDVLVTWLAHDSGDAAWQMAAVDAQAIAFTLALTGGAKRAFERERPSARACRTDPGYDRRCVDQSADGSFFSGHTSSRSRRPRSPVLTTSRCRPTAATPTWSHAWRPS